MGTFLAGFVILYIKNVQGWYINLAELCYQVVTQIYFQLTVTFKDFCGFPPKIIADIKNTVLSHIEAQRW